MSDILNHLEQNPKKYAEVILTICGVVRLRIGALVLPVETYAST